jgi:hypothetical protein
VVVGLAAVAIVSAGGDVSASSPSSCPESISGSFGGEGDLIPSKRKDTLSVPAQLASQSNMAVKRDKFDTDSRWQRMCPDFSS